MAIWRMRIAGCIPKATDTHPEYVILIALPQQKWLHERASILRYTYIACLVILLLLLLLLLFSRLYDVSTSSCAHLTIILSSSSICLCRSSLLPLIPFPPSIL